VGVASLVGLLVLKRRTPMVPGSLVVAALGVLAVFLFDLDEHGVAVVGHIDSGWTRWSRCSGSCCPKRSRV
jgi:MFS superfamily sulfate permease-like transporter